MLRQHQELADEKDSRQQNGGRRHELLGRGARGVWEPRDFGGFVELLFY